MQDQDEDMLIRQAQKGDDKAFERLLRRHYITIYRTAYYYCKHQARAQDIAQEVCLLLAKKLNQYDFRSSFSTWLYRLVINTTKNMLKKDHMQASYDHAYSEQDNQHTSTPEHDLQNKQAFVQLGRLPADLKDTLILVFYNGLSHAQAAAILSCSEGTVSWRINKARKLLHAEVIHG
jgi:RNA polymerase sigma-70 factor, ECF subfamily